MKNIHKQTGGEQIQEISLKLYYLEMFRIQLKFPKLMFKASNEIRNIETAGEDLRDFIQISCLRSVWILFRFYDLIFSENLIQPWV